MRVEYLHLSKSQLFLLKQLARAFLAVAVFGFSLHGCADRKQNKPETPVLAGPPSVSLPMPPLGPQTSFGWIDSKGEHATPRDFRGKVLVLDFYATWCVPCRQSIPRLNALAENYGPQLAVVGLNVGGPDDRVKVAGFARDLQIKYSLGFPDKAMTDLFLADNQTIPQTFVFSREGQPLRRFVGYDETAGVELEKVVAAAVTVNSKQ
ncbi:MAG: hypothetical protein QOD33_1955 [Pyrinomonadaceae bacterium]|nr:hypothetical protein [Pyrinomonadaceae bacterium]